MKKYLHTFEQFLLEAEDPTYYQETFYFTLLISMTKDKGGSRDETKNDIRALGEVLTVTLVEPEQGGIQRDIGTKYLSTLKVHVRKPKNTNKAILMKQLALNINTLKGCSVLRYKEKQPKPRRKAFHGTYSINEEGERVNELDYQKVRRQKAGSHTKMKKRLVGSGGNRDTGGGKGWTRPSMKRGPAPVGFGAMEEANLEEAMKTSADLPEDVVVVVVKESDGSGFQVYYAQRDKPNVRLKAGDLDRMEAGVDIFGTLHVARGRNEPYEGVYVITSAKAKRGFGPLLYDVALEVAGKSGLKPDIESVSDDANAVWKYYSRQRPDVEWETLVSDADEYPLVMPYDRAEDPEAHEHLTRAYFKGDKATTRELKAEKKFIELKPGTKVVAPTPRQELTDLAGELNIPIVKNSDLSRFDRLYEDVLVTITKDSNDLMAFDVQDDLNPKIWNGEETVWPGVKGALMDVVDEFMEGLELDVDIKDVIITGSLANYNWSVFSDIDLHILVDFAEINDNAVMVKKFFDAVRSRWNKLHDIRAKGHEVEIYVQDEHEPHTSTGVYSLLRDEWLVKPQKVKPEIDKATAEKKMNSVVKELDKLASLYHNGRYEESFDMAQRVKDRISRMRQSGLQKTGIYSPENLAFKMLRRSGDIERLFDIYTRSYDKVYSLDQ